MAGDPVTLRPAAPATDLDAVRRALDAMPSKRPAPAYRPSRPAVHPLPPRTALPPAIEANGLTKRFGKATAVDRLSFTVPAGSITGFVGPNGSGKTTTLRMLMHLAKPDEGTARILGHDLQAPEAYLPQVGALIESPAFEPNLSGPRNLLALAQLGRTDPGRIPHVLRLVGLADAGRKRYRHYSLGMKQRLGIAAALLSDPRLLLLDEPTNGLDPAGIREVRDLLQRLANEGKTLLVSSHLLGELQRICTHLILVNEGRLLYQGDVTTFLARAGTRDLEAGVLAAIGGA